MLRISLIRASCIVRFKGILEAPRKGTLISLILSLPLKL